MRLLYVFPHPDDESFGPVAAMHHQLQQGHEVHLLTLTKGEATKKRFDLGLSKEEMAEVRYREMLDVEKTVGLSGMTVLDLPDDELAEMDPREIEDIIEKHIAALQPDVVITYAVHGISGFHDHLVCHAVVKRVFVEMQGSGADYLKRLAFFTVPDQGGPTFTEHGIRLKRSAEHRIDCILDSSPENVAMLNRALDCYVTYQDTINASGVRKSIGQHIYYEFFQEDHDPPLTDICEGL